MKQIYQGIFNFLVSYFLLFLIPIMLTAQEFPINVGDSVSGVLDFPGEIDSYTFCSAADVPIYIRVSSEDIIFLKIELEGPDGITLAQPSSVNVINLVEFTQLSGEHKIIVKSLNGNEEGQYFLSLQRTINPVGAIPMMCNSSVQSNLSFVTEPKPFIFSVEDGTVVDVVLSSSDILFNRLELYGPDGNNIVDPSGVNSVNIQVTLTEEGCYVIFASSLLGNDAGDFSLALNTLSGQCTTNICLSAEICDNQIDDDGDGLIDCQDEDCCNFFTLPVADIDGTFEICEGETSTLIASGGSNYLWNTGETSASITVSEAGDYSVTVSNNDNCMDAKTINLVVHPLPVVTIDGILEFCKNENSTLTADGSIEYVWSTGETGESIIVNLGCTNKHKKYVDFLNPINQAS